MFLNLLQFIMRTSTERGSVRTINVSLQISISDSLQAIVVCICQEHVFGLVKIPQKSNMHASNKDTILYNIHMFAWTLHA